jgi:type II secretory pathway component GspD/PulD (secretin)
VKTPAETKQFIADLTANPQIKVLAAPRLVTEVGRKATFRRGSELPRKAIKPKSGEIPTQAYDFVGTALDTTVTISESGSLIVNLLCEQSERNPSGKTGPSPLNQSRVETMVELQNGQTFMLGFGVDRTVTTPKKLLVLSDIPAIGDTPLTDQRTASQPVELIVLVTATLIEAPVK